MKACGLIFVMSILSAASGPQPPCGTAPLPAYPALDSPPAAQVWNSVDWAPPACTGWAASGRATIIAASSRFRLAGGVDALRARVGAVSRMSGMLYWSTTNQRWQPLIVSAHAVAGAGTDQARNDFSVDELTEGRTLYVQQEDSLLGKALYRVGIHNAAAGRFVFSTENSSPVRYLGIPIFQPGEIQAIYFLERESGEVWRYYSIARMGSQASLLTGGHDASLINRAIASYRYLAGIPLDKEPPAAR